MMEEKLSSKYAIHWKEGESVRSITFKDRAEAYDRWDKAVDDAYYPQTITLYHDNFLLSEYSPMEKRHGGEVEF